MTLVALGSDSLDGGTAEESRVWGGRRTLSVATWVHKDWEAGCRPGGRWPLINFQLQPSLLTRTSKNLSNLKSLEKNISQQPSYPPQTVKKSFPKSHAAEQPIPSAAVWREERVAILFVS